MINVSTLRGEAQVTSCVAWCGGTPPIIAGTGPCAGQDWTGEPRGSESGGDAAEDNADERGQQQEHEARCVHPRQEFP
jgi:hypothetical protein